MVAKGKASRLRRPLHPEQGAYHESDHGGKPPITLKNIGGYAIFESLAELCGMHNNSAVAMRLHKGWS